MLPNWPNQGPKEVEYHKNLEFIARERGINCVMGGINEKYFRSDSKEGKYELKDLFGISDVFVSTSTLEGFGYCFLEAFLSNKPLIGRTLSNVSSDFENNGIDLSKLYDNLMINSKDYGKRSHERKREILMYLGCNQMRKIIKDNKLEKKLNFFDMNSVKNNRENAIKNFNYIDNSELLLKLSTKKKEYDARETNLYKTAV